MFVVFLSVRGSIVYKLQNKFKCNVVYKLFINLVLLYACFRFNSFFKFKDGGLFSDVYTSDGNY